MLGAVHLGEQELLEALEQLAHFYGRFPRESQIWDEAGGRRSPYRTLILFGLSPRTRDSLLVDQCQRLFSLCPDPPSFITTMRDHPETIFALVRRSQRPFIKSAAQFLTEWAGVIPRDRDSLLRIKGVGAKVADCLLGYGFGEEALPVDGHVGRIAGRMFGLERNLSVADLRDELKRVFRDHHCRFHGLGLAMIDLHELLRLHGQLFCNKVPRCADCPVSHCRQRRASFTGSPQAPVSPDYWQDWRGLLLEPTAEPVSGL